MSLYPTLLFRATPTRTVPPSARSSYCADSQSDALRGARQLPHSRLKNHFPCPKITMSSKIP